MSGTAFFPVKSCSLSLGFSKLSVEESLSVSLIHRIGCCKYTPPWISQNKKFFYKLIFRDYKIFRRIPFFYFHLIIIIHFTITK